MILNSLPLTNQKAGEIMSELMDGSVVFPMATCWSYHQNPSSRIQFLLSLFENRAISVQPFCSPMSQYTFKGTRKKTDHMNHFKILSFIVTEVKFGIRGVFKVKERNK